jgi:hypothetical protein
MMETRGCRRVAEGNAATTGKRTCYETRSVKAGGYNRLAFLNFILSTKERLRKALKNH